MKNWWKTIDYWNLCENTRKSARLAKNSTDFELKTILKDSEIEETTEKGWKAGLGNLSTKNSLRDRFF